LPFLIGALFIPLFFHGPRLGMPYVKGGDEPHYLAMINSLINDGNLDLRNVYESARKGSWQIGKKFAGQAIDPHVIWNVGGKLVTWGQVYKDPGDWKKDPGGIYIPERKPEATADVSDLPEHPFHPPGIAYLLAPLLWPFKGTPYTEPLALLCSNLAVILSVFLFRGILRRYTHDPFSLNLSTLLAFLGTPIWAYGRTFFMEPFLILFTVVSFHLVLEKRSGFWAGVMLGLGALLKPNFLILFFPLALFYLKEKQFKTIIWMTAGPIASTAVILYTNFIWYGSPFKSSIAFESGNILNGIGGLLFSWNHGIIPFAPVMVLAFMFWLSFCREHKAEAALFAGGAGIYFFMMALWHIWWGGWCYGPRLVSPVIPLLMIPILYMPQAYSAWTKPMKFFAWLLCLLSLGFNLLGALDGYWDSHPLTIFTGNIS
jgi:hypothetical protein